MKSTTILRAFQLLLIFAILLILWYKNLWYVALIIFLWQWHDNLHAKIKKTTEDDKLMEELRKNIRKS